MRELIQDVRYAFRQLRRSPGFMLTAVLTLSLGIAANMSMFSSIDSMLLHPFTFPNTDRIAVLWETQPQQGQTRLPLTPADFNDFSDASHSYQALAAARTTESNLSGSGLAYRVENAQVTASFFEVFGSTPLLGRWIGAADFSHGDAPVAVLSYGFWKQRMSSDPSVIGRELQLNGSKVVVIGVAHKDFSFPVGAEIWTPLSLKGAEASDRGNHNLQALGLLSPGVTLAQSDLEAQTLAAQIAQRYPQNNNGISARAAGIVKDTTAISGSAEFVILLMAASGFVLLLAVANVANLQLARIAARRKEMALRSALGASAWRILRQLLIECMMPALLAGIVGCLLSLGWRSFIQRRIPPVILQHVPGVAETRLDFRLLLFTTLIVIAAGVLTALAPSWQIAQGNLNQSLQDSARGSTGVAAKRLRAVLVTVEISLAMLLMASAGLLANGFQSLLNVPMGFERGNVMTAKVSLPATRYRSGAQIRGYYDELLQRFRTIPGVEMTAASTNLPIAWSSRDEHYQAEGQPTTHPGEFQSAKLIAVSPDYFPLLRMTLQQGRWIGTQDGPETVPVALVSQSLAAKLWPQGSLGKHLQLGDDATSLLVTVVGVVGDVRNSPWQNYQDYSIYLPLAQAPQTDMAFLVRSSADSATLASAMAAQVRALDPDEPAYDVEPLQQPYHDQICGVEISSQTMMLLSCVALILSATGILAVMAYFVSQRTREIGVRIAVGADRGSIMRMVLSEAALMAAAGLAIGTALSMLLAHALSGLLFGVFQMSLPTILLMMLLLLTTALIAALAPALRASRVDPMTALRSE